MITLDNIFPESIPYPIRSGLIRAVRAAISLIIGGLLVSLADGTLIASLTFIPVAWAPIVVMMLGVTIQAVDKWLREHNLEEEAHDGPLTGNVGDTTPAPVETEVDDPIVFDDPVPVIPDTAPTTPDDTGVPVDDIGTDGPQP